MNSDACPPVRLPPFPQAVESDASSAGKKNSGWFISFTTGGQQSVKRQVLQALEQEKKLSKETDVTSVW